VSYPKECLEFSDVSKFLKYAVGDNYVGLARKLSVCETGGLTFAGVRLFLTSKTNALRLDGNSFVFEEYWAHYHQNFSTHFITTGDSSFASSEALPFPLHSIAEVDEEVLEAFVPLNIPTPVNVIAGDDGVMADDAGELV
jgi:hypothetical protein